MTSVTPHASSPSRRLPPKGLRLPGKVRAEVVEHEALGMAMLGEPMPQVERRLDQARRLFADAESHGTLGVHFTERTLRLHIAHGLQSARFAGATRCRRTVVVLDEVVHTLAPWRSRPGPRALGETLRRGPRPGDPLS